MKTRILVFPLVMIMLFAGTRLAWGLFEGGNNSCFGLNSGNNTCTGGAFNTFIGFDTGFSNGAGADNTFVGNSAGAGNTTGFGNTSIGALAGNNNDIGSNNTFVGFSAGMGVFNATTTSKNTFIGSNAGQNNATGNGNVFLGYSAGSSETGSNKLYIDNCFTGSPCTAPLISGEFDSRNVRIDGTLTMVTVATPSDVRYKKDIYPLESSLNKVMKLQGVTYAWRKEELKGAGFKDGRQIGLIAQDVEKVLPELVHTDGKGYKAIAYDKLAPVLIEAVKELQKEVKEQQKEMIEKKIRYETALKDKDASIERLEKALEIMERRISALENPVKTIALK